MRKRLLITVLVAGFCFAGLDAHAGWAVGFAAGLMAAAVPAEDNVGTRGIVALVNEIDVSAFGGQGLRLGDLNGDGRLDMVIAQNVGQSITCVTALNIDGKILWQVGEPKEGNHGSGFDLPIQIYDFDADGTNDVLCVMGDKLKILNGRNGTVKRAVPLPSKDARDCIIIANFSGEAHPRELVLKNRYNQVWALDRDLNVLWTHTGNTGHYPWPHDFDGDGRDELMCGYTLLNHDGTVRWEGQLQMPGGRPGHSDGIAIANVDGDAAGTQEIALATCTGRTFVLLNHKGELIWKHSVGHAQHIIVGDFRPELPGLEIVGLDRGRKRSPLGVDAMVMYAPDGTQLWREERTDSGGGRWFSIITAVDRWDDRPGALILGYRRGGDTPAGLYDGHGRRVALFPLPTGHPRAQHADMVGDEREEIVLWNPSVVRIYTNAEKSDAQIPAERPQTKRLYNYTHYIGMP